MRIALGLRSANHELEFSCAAERRVVAFPTPALDDVYGDVERGAAAFGPFISFENRQASGSHATKENP